MNKKKTIGVAIVLVLLICIGGILAYFSDTKTAENIFTVGNVKISLTETGWTVDNDGKAHSSDSNASKLMPNTTIAKTPIVTNTGTNDAYIFLKVEIPYQEVTLTSTNEKSTIELFNYSNGTVGTTSTFNDEDWDEISIDGVTGNGVHVFAYRKDDKMTAVARNGVTNTLFDSVTFKADIANPSEIVDSDSSSTDTTDLTVKVKAYAIQSDNISQDTAPATIFGNFNN